MYFGNDGDYKGFFDEKNTNVNDYSYEVIGIGNNTNKDGAVANVNIYNKARTKYVQYKLVYGGTSENPKLLLMYPGTGKTYDFNN